jgi:hypothetical protein
MRSVRFAVACAAVLATCLPSLLVNAAPQEAHDRDAYARDYVQFLTLQLGQWSKEFPQRFYQATMQPPIDANKLSGAAKASAGELGDSLARLTSLGNSKDVMTNTQFRSELEKSLAAAKDLNQGMASQRFPAPLQNDWVQIRDTLNSLARAYKLETLAALEPPAAGGSKGKRGAATIAAVPAGKGLVGYIVDDRCGKRGIGMWANAECVKRCVRDGDKVVLVTQDGKIYQISNRDKITEDSFGQLVTVLGKTEGDTITVESLTL